MKKIKTFEKFQEDDIYTLIEFIEQKSEKLDSESDDFTGSYINYNIIDNDTLEVDFGYSDANRENIYTNEIYGFHFKNRLEKQLGRNSNVDKLIYDMISNIKGYEDYILNKNIDKYNL